MGVWTRSTVVVAALLLVLVVGNGRETHPHATVAAPSPPTAVAAQDTVDRGTDGGWERTSVSAGQTQQGEGTASSVGSLSIIDDTDTYGVLGAERGSGRLATVPGVSPAVGWGELYTFTVEVEDHLAPYAETFAAEVERMLSDPRGWTGQGEFALRRVDGDVADLHVTLASPATVDALCAPLETNGRFSCWNGERAVINVWRWGHGARAYEEDLDGYRTHLINHEVGHALGRAHVDCPAPGEPAPVMMQQTVGVGDCLANPWPYPEGD